MDRPVWLHLAAMIFAGAGAVFWSPAESGKEVTLVEKDRHKVGESGSELTLVGKKRHGDAEICTEWTPAVKECVAGDK